MDSVDGSGMVASAGSAFELHVRAAAHTSSADCGAVDRLILSDLNTNAAQVVSCTEDVARCGAPSQRPNPGLSLLAAAASVLTLHRSDVGSNRTAVCAVSAGAIPLGTYVARLAHAAR